MCLSPKITKQEYLFKNSLNAPQRRQHKILRTFNHQIAHAPSHSIRFGRAHILQLVCRHPNPCSGVINFDKTSTLCSSRIAYLIFDEQLPLLPTLTLECWPGERNPALLPLENGSPSLDCDSSESRCFNSKLSISWAVVFNFHLLRWCGAGRLSVRTRTRTNRRLLWK